MIFSLVTARHLPASAELLQNQYFQEYNHLFLYLVGCFSHTSLEDVDSPASSTLCEVFGDPVSATGILDRLLHHSHVVDIRGDSYCLREKKRTELLAAPTVLVNRASPKGEGHFLAGGSGSNFTRC